MDLQFAIPKSDSNRPSHRHRLSSSSRISSSLSSYTFVRPPHHISGSIPTMTGPVRTAAPRKHVQPPRPPNAWIIYRSEKIRTLPPLKPGEPRRAQADVSRLISDMWKNETEEERSRYELLAEEKKVEHLKKYPGYRFQPQKKEDKQKMREMIKQERQNNRASRKNRSHMDAMSPPTPTLLASIPFQQPFSYYIPEAHHGPAGPSPPLSAATSPVHTGSSPEMDEQATQPKSSTMSQPCSALLTSPSNASIPTILPFIHTTATKTTFPLPLSESHSPSAAWSSQPNSTSSNSGATILSSTDWSHHTNIENSLLPTTDSSILENQFVSFDIPQLQLPASQPWLANGQVNEFEEALQAFLSTTTDPSVFQLNNIDADFLTANPGGEIEVSMGQLPLAFETFLTSEGTISDFTAFDFSSMAGPSSQSLDVISAVTDVNSAVPTGDSVTYNADEFLNFDETFNAIPSLSSPRPHTNALNDGQSTSTPSGSYVPPPGAAYSSTRRVGATWKPVFLDSDSVIERSPPKSWGVPAS
ncbi:hypothetical protein AMATHDRAFT_57692 [Amanita thiersii Skay4041]|uniref:HMG box domain-containing protein n=1 Tax=Amanita thiersii Skay4041 TaxID=703135 RepID=A0A2A9NN91_9AGAR|nr:hypothetical protein AMATHDRAFT_57692 [Amanita thiersii Skay4041]